MERAGCASLFEDVRVLNSFVLTAISSFQLGHCVLVVNCVFFGPVSSQKSNSHAILGMGIVSVMEALPDLERCQRRDECKLNVPIRA